MWTAERCFCPCVYSPRVNANKFHPRSEMRCIIVCGCRGMLRVHTIYLGRETAPATKSTDFGMIWAPSSRLSRANERITEINDRRANAGTWGEADNCSGCIYVGIERRVCSHVTPSFFLVPKYFHENNPGFSWIPHRVLNRSIHTTSP